MKHAHFVHFRYIPPPLRSLLQHFFRIGPDKIIFLGVDEANRPTDYGKMGGSLWNAFTIAENKEHLAINI